MNGKELNGSEIRIDKAKPKGAQEEKTSTNPSMYHFVIVTKHSDLCFICL